MPNPAPWERRPNRSHRGQQAATTPANRITNRFADRDWFGKVVFHPLPMGTIIDQILRVAAGRLRKSKMGNRLCVPAEGTGGKAFDFLDSPSALFGWLGAISEQPPLFMSKPGYTPKAEIWHELRRRAPVEPTQ